MFHEVACPDTYGKQQIEPYPLPYGIVNRKTGFPYPRHARSMLLQPCCAESHTTTAAGAGPPRTGISTESRRVRIAVERPHPLDNRRENG